MIRKLAKSTFFDQPHYTILGHRSVSSIIPLSPSFWTKPSVLTHPFFYREDPDEKMFPNEGYLATGLP